MAQFLDETQLVKLALCKSSVNQLFASSEYSLLFGECKVMAVGLMRACWIS